MKTAILAFTFSLLLTSVLVAQNDGPLPVVQAQLDAYNAQDIDEFAEVFAEDAEIFMNIGDQEPAMKGREEIRERYGRMFKENPQNKSTLMGRMVQGNFVFDHELITGRENAFRIVAIYEVRNEMIQRAWFVR
jgi:hypothetical protein